MMRIVCRLAFILSLLIFAAPVPAEEKLSGRVIYGGSVSTEPNSAFDSQLSTYFATHEVQWTWVGLDLGEPHVVSRIGFAPRNDDNGPGRMLLGVFEGANSPDFIDAVPLYLVSTPPSRSRLTYVDVRVSRGFRYVRYVTPAGGKCNIAEMEVYGSPGQGDDSHFYQVTQLPTVSIHVADNANPQSKGVDHKATIAIAYDDGQRLQEYPILTRVRGNFSASWENKPYRIKFDDDKKHHMLKGSVHESPAKAKKWTLISSYGDKTLMRNPVAYEISRRVGLPFSPWCKPVDLILNGEYRGTYQLTDHVDVKADRVNITEMTADDVEGEALTGGYMIEMNGYASSDPVNFTSSRGNPVTIHSPEADVIQPAQKQYIVSHFNEMERRVFSPDYAHPDEGYRPWLDLTTFLKYFLANEFSSNTDYLWQVYMYKQRGDSHIYTGPVWDNDLALENDYNYYPGNNRDDWVYRVRGAGSWQSLVDRVLSDGAAMAQLQRMWAELRWREVFTAQNIAAYVDSLRQAMAASASLNFKRWPYLNQQLHCNPTTYGTWDAEVDNVRNYVYNRVGWMDGMLGLSLKKKNGRYLINTGYDLCLFADIVNDGETDAQATLTADLDMADCSSIFTPIGSRQQPFCGTLDGQRHTISNLHVADPGGAGLFGCLAGGARIENLTISSSTFTADSHAGAIAALVSGAGQVLLSQVGNSAEVIAQKEYAGGLIGRVVSNDAALTLTNCYNTGHVAAKAHAAALVAYGASALTISNSYNTGQVEGTENGHGLSDFLSGSVHNCFDLHSSQSLPLTAQMVQSGELCYRLNPAGTSLWRQNLDNGRQRDPWPVLLSGHGVVFQTPTGYSNANPNAVGYQYYLLRITQNKGDGVLQMAEFDLLDAAGEEHPALQAYGCNVEGYGNEGWDNLTDHDVATKYCAPFYGDTYILFDAGSQFAPYAYRIYTANDTREYSGRNPHSWQLFASDVCTSDPDDDAWLLIDERWADTTLEATNFTPYDFDLRLQQEAAIATVATHRPATAVYSPDGRQLPALRKGLNIVRLGDGSVRKIINR